MSWLLDELSDEWTAFKAWIVKIKPAVLAFIKPTLQQLTEDEITIAEAAVVVGFATEGDGPTKLVAALAYFAAQSAAKEIPFVESKARTAIELALQNAKAAAAPAAA